MDCVFCTLSFDSGQQVHMCPVCRSIYHAECWEALKSCFVCSKQTPAEAVLAAQRAEPPHTITSLRQSVSVSQSRPAEAVEVESVPKSYDVVRRQPDFDVSKTRETGLVTRRERAVCKFCGGELQLKGVGANTRSGCLLLFLGLITLPFGLLFWLLALAIESRAHKGWVCRQCGVENT